MKIQVLAKYFFVNSRKASERGKSIYKYVIDERAQLDKEERKKTKQEKVFLKRRKSVKHCNFTESKREQTKAIQSERKQAENNKFSKVKTFTRYFFVNSRRMMRREGVYINT